LAVVAVNGERPVDRHQQLVLLAMGVVGTLATGRDAEYPVRTLDLKRDVPDGLGYAQRSAGFLDESERH
jgi:hypothetical protein